VKGDCKDFQEQGSYLKIEELHLPVGQLCLVGVNVNTRVMEQELEIWIHTIDPITFLPQSRVTHHMWIVRCFSLVIQGQGSRI
jgi:hypothetical protein